MADPEEIPQNIDASRTLRGGARSKAGGAGEMSRTSDGMMASLRRRLAGMSRGTAIGAIVGAVVIVVGSDLVFTVGLIRDPKFRDWTPAMIGGGLLFVTAWATVAGVFLGIPLGAIVGTAIGAFFPKASVPEGNPDSDDDPRTHG